MLNNKETYNSIKNRMAGSYYIPLSFKTGENYTIEDIEGKHYLDFSCGYGVTNIGWQNPEMLDSQKKFIDKSNYAPPWMSTIESLELAETLTSYFPNTKYKCFRTTGGANGNEVVISIFYNLCKGNIGTFTRSYHGWSQATLGMGEIQKYKMPNVKFGYESKKIPPPNESTLEDVERFFDENPDVKIFIAEPILGSGGVIIPEKNYWVEFYRICKKKGVYLILDEVITAFGRMGYMFSCQYYGIEPDGIILAKGMSSGYAAIGAVLIKEEYLKDYKFGDVSATFSWTPFACAVTSKNIEIIEKNKLCENSTMIGEYLKLELVKVFDEYCKKIKFEIRGIGLMLSIKFNDENHKHNIYMVGRLVYDFIENGLMFCTSGDNDSIVILPPLTLDKEGCDKAIKIIKDVLVKRNLHIN
jgi:4-aminobutyrate aminotransferase-like enzyme